VTRYKHRALIFIAEAVWNTLKAATRSTNVKRMMKNSVYLR